jgi:hypothetical protein
LRLRRSLPNADDRQRRDDPAREIGGVWTVLTGSPQDPDALWLSQPDGKLRSWSDDESVFEYFEKLTGA